MRVKVISLRRADTCSACAAALPAGTRAQWDPQARTVTCLECVERSGSGTAATEGPEPIDAGTPGASARREFERRHAKREQRLEETWGTGRIGRLAKFLSDDPQSTKAWAEGDRGEQLVAESLSARLGDRAILLHDRRVPGTRGNIDHLAIAASGVWVIDAKKYTGRVKRRDKGGVFRSDERLYVGDRDRSKLIAGLEWQSSAVRQVLGAASVPVHSCLSFVGVEWPLFAKPFQIDGVWVSSPEKLADRIAAAGPLTAYDVDRVARLLADRFPSK